jgi:ribosomal protein S18 acetylase RimI-like enzyme
MLLRHATAEPARRGLPECTLWVLEENAPAQRFYERLGMRADGSRRTYPGTAVPELRYRLALTG